VSEFVSFSSWTNHPFAGLQCIIWHHGVNLSLGSLRNTAVGIALSSRRCISCCYCCCFTYKTKLVCLQTNLRSRLYHVCLDTLYMLICSPNRTPYDIGQTVNANVCKRNSLQLDGCIKCNNVSKTGAATEIFIWWSYVASLSDEVLPEAEIV